MKTRNFEGGGEGVGWVPTGRMPDKTNQEHVPQFPKMELTKRQSVLQKNRSIERRSNVATERIHTQPGARKPRFPLSNST